MTDHTPEPWEFEGIHVLPKPKMRIIHQWEGVAQRAELEANAARIVACVNACAGIPTEQLGNVKALLVNFGELLSARDTQLAARQQHQNPDIAEWVWDNARAALAAFRKD